MERMSWSAQGGVGHIDYQSGQMRPEDYIALAINTFYNETFRKALHQK